MMELSRALSLLAFLSLSVLAGFVTYLSARPTAGFELVTPVTWWLVLVVAAVVTAAVWTDRRSA